MRKAKRYWVIALAMILILSLAACGSGGDGSNTSDTIKIAYIGPLTGEAAAWGEPELNTFKMMVDKCNEEGGILGKKIELKSYDNRNDNVETTNAAKKAIENDKVVAIFGCNSSGTSLALGSVCDELKVPHLATTATNTKVTVDDNGNVRPWSFRVTLTDPQFGGIMAQYAYNVLGLRTFSNLYNVSSDYSIGVNQNFIDEFTRLGGKILANEAYKDGDVDFRAQLMKIKESNPEGIYLAMQYKELSLATEQARDLGIKQNFYGPDVWLADDVLKMNAGRIEGSMFVAQIDMQDASLNDFNKWYKSEYDGEDPTSSGTNAYMAYDAFMVMKAAIEKAGAADPEEIRDALETVTDVEGIVGPVSMDPKTHNPVRMVHIFRIDPGKFTSVEKFIPETN